MNFLHEMIKAALVLGASAILGIFLGWVWYKSLN